MAPESDQSGEITVLLHQWRDGDAEAENQLFEIVEPNLRRLAHYLMKREWRDLPLQATELVSEAYLKLLNARDRDWQNRKHFFALAAKIMRRHLIDIVRRSGRGCKTNCVNDVLRGK
jgi:RNA polymerase sigma factor (TIGR02999 family)